MNYRAAPHSSTRVSPAQALMGRQIKTRLPVLPQNLIPKAASDEELCQADQRTKTKYKQQYDRRHGAVLLPPLENGDKVMVKLDQEHTWNKEGVVVAADPINRTYLVDSPTGILR